MQLQKCACETLLVSTIANRMSCRRWSTMWRHSERMSHSLSIEKKEFTDWRKIRWRLKSLGQHGLNRREPVTLPHRTSTVIVVVLVVRTVIHVYHDQANNDARYF